MRAYLRQLTRTNSPCLKKDVGFADASGDDLGTGTLRCKTDHDRSFKTDGYKKQTEENTKMGFQTLKMTQTLTAAIHNLNR